MDLDAAARQYFAALRHTLDEAPLEVQQAFDHIPAKYEDLTPEQRQEFMLMAFSVEYVRTQGRMTDKGKEV